MRQGGSIVDFATILAAVASPPFLKRLERFRLVGHASANPRPGSTPVRRGSQASGLELANYRPYVSGDDLRHFDWLAYGRLDQKLIKTFTAEREVGLHLLIDTSASMGVPAGDGKLAFAAGLAASLAYVALRQHDPVRLVPLGDSLAASGHPTLFRHPGRFGDLRNALAHLRPRGATVLSERVAAHLRTTGHPGLAIVLSDFLVPPDSYERALEALLGRGFTVAAIRVIGAEERAPSSLGNRVRLCDSESGAERLVDLTPAHRAAYRAALDAHLNRLAGWCRSHAVTQTAADTSAGIEACVFRELPRLGLLL